MDPRPDNGEKRRRGSGKLKGRKAVISRGDSGIGHAVAIAMRAKHFSRVTGGGCLCPVTNRAVSLGLVARGSILIVSLAPSTGGYPTWNSVSRQGHAVVSLAIFTLLFTPVYGCCSIRRFPSDDLR
jgi:hypothetical protein